MQDSVSQWNEMCDVGCAKKDILTQSTQGHREKIANCSVFPVIPVRDISLSPRITDNR